jgi:diguanylate cyclase (GGDEF)-like protein
VLFTRIRRTVGAGFLLAAVVVIGFVIGTLALTRDVESAARWVAHTREVQREIERFTTSLSDVGASTRGYVVTGAPDYLAEYRLAAARARDCFADLRRLTRDNPAQQKRLDEVDEALTVRLRTAERIVSLRQDRGFESARDEVMKGAYLIEMTRLRLLIADLLFEEDRLLSKREAHVTRLADLLRAVLVALGVLCVAALLPMYLALRRLLREQEVESRRDAELALHDPLTGLPNRRLLLDRLAHALTVARRQRTETAVLFLDLDGFKAVNDSFGHDVGDALLEAVAERLAKGRRSSDTVARIAGDEFVVVLDHLRDARDVEQVAREIIDALSRPYALGSTTARIGTSVGWAVYPHDGLEAAVLMRRADTALYAAKRGGKGRAERWNARLDLVAIDGGVGATADASRAA